MGTHMEVDVFEKLNFINKEILEKEFINYELVIAKYLIKYFPYKPSPIDMKNVKVIKLKGESEYYQTKVACVERTHNYYLEISDSKTKILIPYSESCSKIVIDNIFQNIHLALTSVKIAFPNGYYSMNLINEVIDDAIEHGIAIWFDKCIKKLGSVPERRYKELGNNFTEIIKTMKEISLNDKIESLSAPIGFFVKRADEDNKTFGFSYNLYLKHIMKRECVYYPQIFRLNRIGMILEKVNKIKNFSDNILLPSDLSKVIELCDSVNNGNEPYYQAICLLQNKDIAVIRKGELRYIFRNKKWYNLSYNYFMQTFEIYYSSMQEHIIKVLYEQVISNFLHNRECFIHLPLPNDLGDFEDMIYEKYPHLCFKYKLNEYYDLKGIDEYYYELIKRHKDRDIPINVKKMEKTYLNDLTRSAEIISLNHRGDLIALLSRSHLDIPNTSLESSAKELSKYGMIIFVSCFNDIKIYINNRLVYLVN